MALGRSIDAKLTGWPAGLRGHIIVRGVLFRSAMAAQLYWIKGPDPLLSPRFALPVGG